MGAFERLPDDRRVGRKMMSPSMLIDMREGAKFFHSKYVKKEMVKEETSAMKLGSMIHMAVLEPDKFKDTYQFLEPKENFLTTNADLKSAIRNLGQKPVSGSKADLIAQLAHIDNNAKIWETYYEHALSNGKQILTADQARACNRVVEEVSKHHWLSRAIKGGVYEQAGWFDHPCGLTFSFRLDYYNPNMGKNSKNIKEPVIIDLKATTIQNKWKLSQYVHKAGWAIQAYAYVEGVRRITGVTPKYVWATLEPCPPYRITTYAADEACLEQGKSEFLRLCHDYLSALELDAWGDDGLVHMIGLPRYALDDNHDSDFAEYD